MKALGVALLVAAIAGCAQPAAAPAPEARGESLVPGTIGILVRQEGDAVRVSAVRPEGAAAAAGVQPGDVVEGLNGAPVTSARQFYRRVLDVPPGARVRLELRRGGALRNIEVPVRQIDTTPRA